MYSLDFVNHSVLPPDRRIISDLPLASLVPLCSAPEKLPPPSLVPKRVTSASLFHLPELRIFRSRKLRQHIREWSVSTHSENPRLPQ